MERATQVELRPSADGRATHGEPTGTLSQTPDHLVVPPINKIQLEATGQRSLLTEATHSALPGQGTTGKRRVENGSGALNVLIG